jgi:hypothetical protein
MKRDARIKSAHDETEDHAFLPLEGCLSNAKAGWGLLDECQHFIRRHQPVTTMP